MTESSQLSHKVRHHSHMREFILGSSPPLHIFDEGRNNSEKIQIVLNARIQWVHEDTAEDGENCGHGIEDYHPILC